MRARALALAASTLASLAPSAALAAAPRAPVLGGAAGWPAPAIVNDDVMGGMSESAAWVSPASRELTFAGSVSTARNGGFASVRLPLGAGARAALSGARALAVTLRGDGARVVLRVRVAGAEFHYEAELAAPAGGAPAVAVARAADMRAKWRGMAVPGAPPLDLGAAVEVGFMVTKAQRVGAFAVDVIEVFAEA